MRILITGGTGFLGHQLVEQLLAENHDLALVTRQNPSLLTPFPGQIIPWPISAEYHAALKNIEAVIHLAGEPIGDARWSKERKQQIYDSRIQGTRHIVDLLRLMPNLHTFLCASAVGYYGNNHNDDLDESSPAGQGFLAELCRDWEFEAQRAARPNVRVINLRTGVVLGRNGGALAKLEPFFQNHMGGPAGDGNQPMSWIHEKDWVKAVIHCLHDKTLSGPVNMTSPEPVTNKTFSVALAQIFGQSRIMPAPAFALQLALGEMASIALDGQRALPKKLLGTKFKFAFSDLHEALIHLYDINETHRVPDELYTTSQWVPAKVEDVFTFFSDLKYLEKIIPSILELKVVSISTKTIGKGTLFNCEMKSHGFPIKWKGEVVMWKPPYAFADQQNEGPYARWYHECNLIPACGGTLIQNKVLFRMPMGAIGRLGVKWLAVKDIKDTFAGRRLALAEVFSNERK